MRGAIIGLMLVLVACQPLLHSPERGAPQDASILPVVEEPKIVEPVAEETKEEGPKPFRPDLGVHFLDVGYGDATLIQTPSRKNILIDCGPPEAAKGIVDYLKAIRLPKLDVLIVTHPHKETVGGCAEVMKAFPPGIVYDNRVEPENEYYDAYEYQASKARLERLHVGKRILLDDKATAYILTAFDKETGMKLENDESLVLSLRYGDIGFLFMGHCLDGCEERLMENVVDRKDLDVDVLRVGHSGDKDGTSQTFLDAVSPGVAIISVGKNRFGFPQEDVLDRLAIAGADVYRTDLHGTVVMRTNGEHLVIETEKGESGIGVETCPFIAARASTKFYPAACSRGVEAEERLCFSSRAQALESGRQMGEC